MSVTRHRLPPPLRRHLPFGGVQLNEHDDVLSDDLHHSLKLGHLYHKQPYNQRHDPNAPARHRISTTKRGKTTRRTPDARGTVKMEKSMRRHRASDNLPRIVERQLRRDVFVSNAAGVLNRRQRQTRKSVRSRSVFYRERCSSQKRYRRQQHQKQQVKHNEQRRHNAASAVSAASTYVLFFELPHRYGTISGNGQHPLAFRCLESSFVSLSMFRLEFG